MELIRRREPLQFKHEDVVFLVKPQTTAADRMEMFMSGRVEACGSKMTVADFNKALIRCFVVGWKGVTFEGKEVPYAYETLMDSFPNNDDVLTRLSAFILEHTDAFKKDEALKKELREPRHGG